jgi:hypothetical protein
MSRIWILHYYRLAAGTNGYDAGQGILDRKNNMERWGDDQDRIVRVVRRVRQTICMSITLFCLLLCFSTKCNKIVYY